MSKRLCLVILLCLISSGCASFDGYLKKKVAVPVIPTVKEEAETETVWVEAKTRKVWVNPHIDDDGSMVDGHYKYVVLEEGHWALQEITPEVNNKTMVKVSATDE